MAGRRLLEQRADRLREVTIPVLQAAVDTADSDGYADAAYARARRELSSLTDVLATAVVLPAGKTAPGVVELGDQVTVEDLDPHPGSPPTGSGSVRRWLLVHPAEAGVEADRLSAASPLGGAIIGRRVGDVVWVDAPGGRYRARIRATGRPRRRRR